MAQPYEREIGVDFAATRPAGVVAQNASLPVPHLEVLPSVPSQESCVWEYGKLDVHYAPTEHAPASFRRYYVMVAEADNMDQLNKLARDWQDELADTHRGVTLFRGEVGNEGSMVHFKAPIVQHTLNGVEHVYYVLNSERTADIMQRKLQRARDNLYSGHISSTADFTRIISYQVGSRGATARH